MEKLPFLKNQGKVNVQERLRILTKKQRHAVLATDADGQPYTSLVAFALTPDMEGVLFATPKKTGKYRNLMKNRNVSLLIDTRSNSAKGYMQSEALTILGTAIPVRRGKQWNDMARFLIQKHPQLEEFVRAHSTALVRIAFTKVLHTGGFQSVTAWELNKQ
jgi:nitroimidazol reductase NimA-like FMN-containing flavoprotein (pyridoxamine 5'-phosphate oxidase superfamily)